MRWRSSCGRQTTEWPALHKGFLRSLRRRRRTQKSGCLNWLPFTVVFLKLGDDLFLFANLLTVIKYQLIFHLRVDWLHFQSLGFRWANIHAGAAAGAVQGGNGHDKFHAGRPVKSLERVSAGALASSSSVMAIGRMTECGQTSEQRLHWIQCSGIHSGTSTAMPRFS